MNTDWDQLEACKEALREHMALVRERDDEIERLRDELSDATIKLENEKLGAEMIYQENDRLMHDCQNFLNEIERLRAQEPVIYVTPDGDGWRMRFEPPISDVSLMGWMALYNKSVPPSVPERRVDDSDYSAGWNDCIRMFYQMAAAPKPEE